MKKAGLATLLLLVLLAPACAEEDVAQFLKDKTVRIIVGVGVMAVMERESIGADEARSRVKHTDENRRAYIRQVYGHTWDLPGHYDLVLDTGRLGYEATIEAILAALKGRVQQSG